MESSWTSVRPTFSQYSLPRAQNSWETMWRHSKPSNSTEFSLGQTTCTKSLQKSHWCKWTLVKVYRNASKPSQRLTWRCIEIKRTDETHHCTDRETFFTTERKCLAVKAPTNHTVDWLSGVETLTWKYPLEEKYPETPHNEKWWCTNLGLPLAIWEPICSWNHCPINLAQEQKRAK